MHRSRTHPSVDPDVADGETTPLPDTPGHPSLDGRARTAGQTWIGWRVNLLPGEVAAAADPDRVRRREARAAAERAAARRAIQRSRAAGRARTG